MVYLNQQQEAHRKQSHEQEWKSCSKYRILFENNINNEHLWMIVQDSYKNFISNLKSIHIQATDKKKYIRIWKTLINTIDKNHDIDITRIATKQFNYSIYINSLKNK